MKKVTLNNGIKIIEAEDNSCRIITPSGEVFDFDSTGKRATDLRTYATIYNKSGVDIFINDICVKNDETIVVPEPLNNRVDAISTNGTCTMSTKEGERTFWYSGKLRIRDGICENEYGRKNVVIYTVAQNEV